MWMTNLKVLAVGLGTIAFYTFVAQIIPQLESEVPETLDLSAGVTPEILITAGSDLFTIFPKADARAKTARAHHL